MRMVNSHFDLLYLRSSCGFHGDFGEDRQSRDADTVT